MSPPITIRRATPSDLPQMAALLIKAFSPGPWSRHLFPLRLRVQPGDADELAFRLHQLSSSRFGAPGSEHVCAVSTATRHPGAEGQGEGGGEDVVVGWAQWIDRDGQVGLDGEKEEEKKKKEVEAGRGEGESGPQNVAGLDREALDRLALEGELVEKRLEEYLGEEGTTNSRLLNFLLVDPSHQRKGIGRLLAQEGLDHAAKAGKDVRLRSTPEGRPLYLALGFEDVFEQKVIGESQYGMVWRAPAAVKTVGEAISGSV